MVVNKIEAARVLLDAAIEHFFNDNHVCAVTLAGAAEDLMKGISRYENNIDTFDFLYKDLVKRTKAQLSKKEFGQQLYRARNWLKHYDIDPDKTFDVVARDSLMMIMAVIPMYRGNTNNDTDQMLRFKKYRDDNPDAIEKAFNE